MLIGVCGPVICAAKKEDDMLVAEAGRAFVDSFFGPEGDMRNTAHWVVACKRWLQIWKANYQAIVDNPLE